MPIFSRMRAAPLVFVPMLLCAEIAVTELLRQAEQRLDQEQFDEAELLLHQVLRAEPVNTQALYRLGYSQFRQRKLAQARQSFAAVIKAAPPAYNSRYFLGRIALLENKPKEAITWLEPVVASNEKIFDAASQLANAYADAGTAEKAAGALRMAIAEAPWDGSLYYRLGQLHKQLGQAELAREAFENSRKLRNASREDVETMMSASKAIGEGRTAEALQLGARILARDDADPNALVALGVIYGKADLANEALHAFERAAQRDAKLFQAHFNQGLALLKANRAPESLAPLSRAVELLPQSLEANVTFGLASVMNQRYAEAIGALERAWQMDPANTRVGALLATSYLRTGRASNAVPILRNLTQRAPNDPAPLLLLVEALNGIEDTNGALEAAKSAQKQFPGIPQSHMAVAQQLARLGKYQDARPVFERVLAIAPGLPEAELGLADTLQKAGEHASAAGNYRAAMTHPGTAMSARLGLARSLIALRRLDEARTVLEEGLPLYPSDASLRIELSRVYARLGKSDLAAEQTKIIEQLRAADPAR
jgi:tetratricopeptide (TPR) repeat protein